MSGWTFSASINISDLEKRIAELGNMEAAIEDVAQEIKDETVNNIKTKNIIDTGALRDSITYEMQQDGFIVRDGVEYGVYNEFGTSRMAARPFMIPAAEKFYTFIVRRFTELLK